MLRGALSAGPSHPQESTNRERAVYDKEALIALVRHKSLKFGDFTLVSGKKAKYYLDGKQVTLDPNGSKLIAEGILDLLAEGEMPDAVGGMSIGADPITSAVVTMSAVRGTPVTGFMVRKEPKGHGTNQYIEGPVEPGQKVVIVEDVVTTGGSSLTAIERVEAFGLKVTGVIAIIDRMEGGSEAFAKAGYELRSLLAITDFGITPPE
jgi:orotate phosphoribosyltransferase